MGTLLAGTIILRPNIVTDFDIQIFSISLLGLSKTRIIIGNNPA